MARTLVVISFLCCSANFLQVIDAWHQSRWLSSPSNRISTKLNVQGKEADKLSIEKSMSDVRMSKSKANNDNRSSNIRNGTKESRKFKGKNVFVKDQLEFQKVSKTQAAALDIEISDEKEEELGIQATPFKSGFISIIGNANVGKSTLMNALLGEQLCIVSLKPQTTRHRILGILTNESSSSSNLSGTGSNRGNFQLIFSDTPGMLSPAYKLQETMQETIRGAVGDADVILLVTDVYGEPLEDERVMQRLAATNRTIIIAVNKIDLLTAAELVVGVQQSPYPTSKEGDSGAVTLANSPPRNGESVTAADIANREYSDFYEAAIWNGQPNPNPNFNLSVNGSVKEGRKERGKLAVTELTALWKQRLPAAELVFISAAKNEGVENLLDRLLAHVSEGPKYFPKDMLTTRDERFFASEIIREALFTSFKDEIPYSCEVVTESFKDKTPSLSVIEASIVVSRDSQKLIVIGKGGNKLKEVGTKARAKMEEFLRRKVFLSLKVKVDPDWRNSQESLQKYGYIDSDL